MSAPIPGEPRRRKAYDLLRTARASSNPSKQALPFSEAAREAAADRLVDLYGFVPNPGAATVRSILAAAVDADPRAKAFLKLAALSDEELVDRFATALAAYNGYDLSSVRERPAHGDDERWAQCDYRQQARAVLAALGLPVAEQETTG